MSTRLIAALYSSFVVLSLVVMMKHQTTIGPQLLQAQQTSRVEILDKLSTLEIRVMTEQIAYAKGLRDCNAELQQVHNKLVRQMESLLVKQELRLLRTLGIQGTSKPQAMSNEQVIQPTTYQTIFPEHPTATEGATQVIGVPLSSGRGR